MAKTAWYAIVHCGGGRSPTPAKGPFKSKTEAEDALRRFRERHGHRAGTYLAATSSRIVGPFRSRTSAKNVDIGDACAYLR